MSFWKTTRRAVLASAALLLTVGGVSAASPTMPENNRETIAQYFSLVDVAGKSAVSFDELISLYADTAEVYSNDGSVSHGKEELRKNTQAFYQGMTGGESRHFYQIIECSGDTAEVDWAVAAKMPDGNVLALQGHNTYRFDANHKIVYLLVRNRS